MKKKEREPPMGARPPLKYRIDDLLTYQPITFSQEVVYKAWDEGNHIVMAGTAGTGKTFSALYLGLEEVLDKSSLYEKVIIVRSIVPTREVGFLPGSLNEKIEAYTGPYRAITQQLFEDKEAYDKLSNQGALEFMSTSYIRGITFNNAVIVIDEMQNLSFHELDSVVTRVGENCRIIFCGDYHQSDFTKENEKSGLLKFLDIVEHMTKFTVVNFNWSDIVRSDFVRDYIMTKEMLGIHT